MISVLRDFLKAKITDHSDEWGFSFAIVCACCNREYKTLPIRYFPHPESTSENDERRRLHDWALEEALGVFAANLNYCRACERFVCDDCFLICTKADLCRDCVRRLGLTGVTVKDAR